MLRRAAATKALHNKPSTTKLPHEEPLHSELSLLYLFVRLSIAVEHTVRNVPQPHPAQLLICQSYLQFRTHVSADEDERSNDIRARTHARENCESGSAL